MHVSHALKIRIRMAVKMIVINNDERDNCIAGVSLTNYGEQLLPYVNAVLNCDESLKQEIAELNGLKQGKVKIGVFSSVCTSWLPEILHSFKKKYTEIDIEVFQGTYDDVVYWIKNGVVDLGFLSVSSAKDIPIEPLYRDELLCVLPSGTKANKSTNYIDVFNAHVRAFSLCLSRLAGFEKDCFSRYAAP